MKNNSVIRNYLQMFRAQTAPATTILIIIGFLVGGGKLFSFLGLFLFIFSILLHWFIFGNNSLMDSCIVPEIGALSYDAQDKGKQHHPLISGKIKFSTAHKVIYTGIIFLICGGMLFSFYGIGDTSLSLAFFIIFIVTGFAYNCGLSKVTVWKFVPISICFTSLIGYAYFITADMLNNIFIYILIYVLLTEIFEIGVLGEQKEIETNEVNILRFLGTKVSKDKIKMSFSSKLWSWLLKIFNLLIGFFILCYLKFNLVSVFLFSLFTVLIIYFSVKIIEDENWGRSIKLRYYGFEEICTIYIIPSILIPIIGLIESLILMIFGIFYFILLNYINWKSFFAPKV